MIVIGVHMDAAVLVDEFVQWDAQIVVQVGVLEDVKVLVPDLAEEGAMGVAEVWDITN